MNAFGVKRRSPNTAVLLLGAAVSSWGGCDESPQPPPPAPRDAATSGRNVDVQRQAQRDAFARLEPRVAAFLVEVNPEAAFVLDRGPLRLPPLDPSAADDALPDLWRDASEIAPRFLEPLDAVVLQTMLAGLAQRRESLRRPPAWQSDPLWIIADLERVWTLAREAEAQGQAYDADALLAAMAGHLSTGLRRLGATSAPVLGTARVRLEALAAEIDHRFPTDADARRTWSEALSTSRARLAAIEVALPAASAATYEHAIVPAPDPAQVARLPHRLGATELARRLADEESIARTAQALFVALGPTIARLQSLANTPETSPDASRPVDAARCPLFEAQFLGARANQPRLATAWLDCPAALRMWGDTALSDAAFMLAALDRAVIHPLRDRRRRDERAVLALVSGRIAPVSQRLGQRVALATLLGAPRVPPLAAREALHAACLAAAALWIHGSLGTDEALLERLEARCSIVGAPSSWIDAAEGDPRGALQGLELWRLGHGPADVVALDRYWWVPAGLVSPLADPTPPPAATIEVHAEELSP